MKKTGCHHSFYSTQYEKEKTRKKQGKSFELKITVKYAEIMKNFPF